MPHTPGPWKINYLIADHEEYKEININSDEDDWIAMLGKKGVKRNEANAKLISKTPDLYKYLYELTMAANQVAYDDAVEDTEEVVYLRDWIKKSYVLINEIRGLKK